METTSCCVQSPQTPIRCLEQDPLLLGLGMAGPPQWEGKMVTFNRSLLHTWLCWKCFRCANSCNPHPVDPVGELRLKWLAQSFIVRGWGSWRWGWVCPARAPSLGHIKVWSLNHICILAFPFLMRFLELWSFLMKICPLSTLTAYRHTFSISYSYSVFIKVKCAQKSSFHTSIEGTY